MSLNYPETAALLLTQAPEILRRWDERVRREILASRVQKPLVLQNNLGRLLIEGVRALSPADRPEETIHGLNLSHDHGGHWASLMEYSVGEMFLEYRLLRQTILEVLDEKWSLPPEEREVITNALEQAMQEAVSGFALVHPDAERERGDVARALAAELKTADERGSAPYCARSPSMRWTDSPWRPVMSRPGRACEVGAIQGVGTAP